jgi:hypothetical protein
MAVLAWYGVQKMVKQQKIEKWREVQSKNRQPMMIEVSKIDIAISDTAVGMKDFKQGERERERERERILYVPNLLISSREKNNHLLKVVF